MERLQATEEKVFKEKGIDLPRRLQAWNSLCSSRLLFQCVTWGFMTSVPWQNLAKCYHSSHRQILARPAKEGSRTNEGVRADAQVLSLENLLSTRLIRLAHHIFYRGLNWMHGLIQATDDDSQGCFSIVRKDSTWLDVFEHQKQLPYPHW